METIGSFIAGIIITIGSVFGLVPQDDVFILNNKINSIERKVQEINLSLGESDDIMLGSYSPSGGGTYRLKSSAAISDTTINLSSFKEPVSNIPYTMNYLGSNIMYGTLQPQVSDKSEFISFTGITQNSDGSAQLTGVTRGLTRTPAGEFCTASSTFSLRHPAQTIFILSDSPCHFAEYTAKDNDEVVTGQWSFPYPAASSSVASKGYVDSIALGGTATVDRLIVTGVAGESVTAGDLIYLNRYDGEWYKTDSDTASTSDSVLLGIAQGSGSNGVSVGGGILLKGLDANQSGLTAGTIYYISTTAGDITSTAPTNSATTTRKIGQARNTTNIYFDPYLSSAVEDGNNAFTGQNTFTASTTFTSTTTVDLTFKRTIYDSSGTWTKPSGTLLKYVEVELWGAGGSGGTAAGTAGGGGGGSYAKKRIFASELSTSETVTIGAGGAAVLDAANAVGNPGGNTTFGSHLTAYGGGGGGNGDGGGGGGGVTSAGASGSSSVGGAGGGPVGGAGGSASVGSTSTYGGGGGGDAQHGGESVFGGGGGGGGGSSLQVNGGNSYYGGGGGGVSGNVANVAGTSVFGGSGGVANTAGSVPGGGGGGASAGNNSGAGAAGRAIVTEYYF